MFRSCFHVWTCIVLICAKSFHAFISFLILGKSQHQGCAQSFPPPPSPCEYLNNFHHLEFGDARDFSERDYANEKKNVYMCNMERQVNSCICFVFFLNGFVFPKTYMYVLFLPACPISTMTSLSCFIVTYLSCFLVLFARRL